MKAILKFRWKHILIALAVTAVMLPFISCEKSGYLTTVTFPAEGGVFEGVWDKGIYAVEIHDSEGNSVNDNECFIEEWPDTVRMKLKWLSYKQVPHMGKIELRAEPNNTGKQREIYLEAMVENSLRFLTVIQKP